MWVEFKEKPYETYFLAELARRTNILYSPDQTDEGVLGFDGAFFLALPEWREFFPFVRMSRWHRFGGIPAAAIDEFGQALNERLPPFNLNLFVQYKRPEWLGRSNASEWPSWDAPYFRYAIEEKQQRLLERIHQIAAGRAAVVYAAAAFRTSPIGRGRRSQQHCERGAADRPPALHLRGGGPFRHRPFRPGRC